MATNYDATDAAFSSLTQMENYRGAMRCTAWEEMAHELEVDAMRDYNRHYCRPGAQPASTDIKTYDVGNFQLAVSGVAMGQIGELFVEYDIDLFDPRVPVPIGQALPMAHIVSSVAGATAAAPFGTGSSIKSGSNLPGLTASGTTLTIPQVGRYLIQIIYTSGTISSAPTISVGTATTLLALFVNNAASGNTVSAITTNSIGILNFAVDVTAPNGTLTMGGGGTYTGGNTDVFVEQISSGLTKPIGGDIEEIDRLYRMLRASVDEKARGDGQPRRPHQKVAVEQDSDDEKGYVKTANLAGQAAMPATKPSTASAASAAGVPGSDPPSGTKPKKGFFSA